MPPPKIFQAFKRSNSRGGAAAAAHGMEPRPYDYGSVGRNYGQDRVHSAYSSRTPIDGDDDEYEDLREYQDIRHSMVPTSMAPSDFRTHSMAPSDADFRPHSIGPTSIAPSEFSESRIPRVQRLDDPRSTIYGTIPEEEDDETARTVSDGYVDIGRHPQEQYYHEAGPSQHHEAGTSRYHESGSPQYTEYRPGEHHHSHSRPRPAYHNQAPEQPSMRHGSSRRQTDHEPTVLDYRSQATSYMPSHAQPHIPTYGPDTSSQPQMRQPAPPQDRAFHIPPPGTYEYERAPTGMEGARGEFARQPRRQAQYNQTPGHTTQHVPSREYVQPLIHTVSRRRSAETYYIIPNNKPVIFKDERGNEIARVGDFSGRRRSRRKHPLIIQDEYGRELYRTGDVHDGAGYHQHHEQFDGSDHSSRTSESSPRQHLGEPYRHEGSDRTSGSDSYGLPVKLVDQWGRPISPRIETVSRHGSTTSSRSGRPSRPALPPNVILIDDFGNQIPIQVPSAGTNTSRYRPSGPQGYEQHPQMMPLRDPEAF